MMRIFIAICRGRLNDVLTKQHFVLLSVLTVPYNTRFLHCTTHFEIITLKYIFESALNSGPSQRALNFVLLYGRY